MNSLPEDADARNAIPLADGLLDYFPNALCDVAKVSAAGNRQHNGNDPMHWARGKSTDHRNKILRHLVDSGRKDAKGVRHSAYLAWRALALLQEEIEREEGVPLPRNARPSAPAEPASQTAAPAVVPHSLAAAMQRDLVPPEDDEGQPYPNPGCATCEE